ncbi:ubiquitin/ISG15-conjugating enzyme E2 L6 isoform X2 [Monodelphis domestica]|nr:ubiquitin/ISG15-conjugating enzyme E2 L6 isoform X2 [Monodelphis domestica]
MLQDNLPSYLQDLCSEGSNVLIWNATLLPDLEPYNLRAFRFRITFPRNYPYKPPQLNFVTSIYHPQVTENGEVCLPSLHSNWKAHTTIHQVLEELISLVNNPNRDLPLRPVLANLYVQNRIQFMENAKEHTLQFGENRPGCQ